MNITSTIQAIVAHPLSSNVAVLIFGGVIGAVIDRKRIHSTLVLSHASIKAVLTTLQKEYADLESKYTESQQHNLEQKTEFDRQFGRESLLNRYPFFPELGHHVLDSKHYCHSCLIGPDPRPVEMCFSNNRHWCKLCDKPKNQLMGSLSSRVS